MGIVDDFSRAPSTFTARSLNNTATTARFRERFLRHTALREETASPDNEKIPCSHLLKTYFFIDYDAEKTADFLWLKRNF